MHAWAALDSDATAPAGDIEVDDVSIMSYSSDGSKLIRDMVT